MEIDLAVDILVSGTQKRLAYQQLSWQHSETIAKIKKLVPHEITKESDINYV